MYSNNSDKIKAFSSFGFFNNLLHRPVQIAVVWRLNIGSFFYKLGVDEVKEKEKARTLIGKYKWGKIWDTEKADNGGEIENGLNNSWLSQALKNSRNGIKIGGDLLLKAVEMPRPL